jgi:hypothetical protein
MNKQDLSERDICSKFIGRAGWDKMMQMREQVSFFDLGSAAAI